jgi:hypothetical protein
MDGIENGLLLARRWGANVWVVPLMAMVAEAQGPGVV